MLRARDDFAGCREKLEYALAIFSQLNMAGERDAVLKALAD